MQEPVYTAEDLEREAIRRHVTTGILKFGPTTQAMLRDGAKAKRDLIEARAERDVAVIAKENAERILQTLNQDDMRHQWITMKTHREAEAKARLDAEDALAKAQARVKKLEQHVRTIDSLMNTAFSDESGKLKNMASFGSDYMQIMRAVDIAAAYVEQQRLLEKDNRAALEVKP